MYAENERSAGQEEESKVVEVAAEVVAEQQDNFDTEVVAVMNTDNKRKPMAFLDDKSDSEASFEEEAKAITSMQDHFMEIMNN